MSILKILTYSSVLYAGVTFFLFVYGCMTHDWLAATVCAVMFFLNLLTWDQIRKDRER